MYGHVLHLTLCLTQLWGLDLTGYMMIHVYICPIHAQSYPTSHSERCWTVNDLLDKTEKHGWHYKAFLQWWHALRSHSHAWMLESNGSGATCWGHSTELDLFKSSEFWSSHEAVMNPDSLAMLRGIIGLAVHGNIWKWFGLCTRPSFPARWSLSQPERVSLSHGSGSGPAFPGL